MEMGTHLIENVLELVLSQCAALHVFDGSQILRHALAILASGRDHFLFRQLLQNHPIVSQIDLRSYNKTRYSWAMVVDFWKPLLANVLKGSR